MKQVRSVVLSEKDRAIRARIEALWNGAINDVLYTHDISSGDLTTQEAKTLMLELWEAKAGALRLRVFVDGNDTGVDTSASFPMPPSELGSKFGIRSWRDSRLGFQFRTSPLDQIKIVD